MKLSIIIPNYNGAELLKKNLPQVFAATAGAEVIVVDDASTDAGVAMLKNDFPDVQVVAKAVNEGFSSTVNAGVAAAKHDLVMLLNSDAFPLKGSIERALVHFKNPDVFAVGLAQECTEDGKTVIRGRGLGAFRRGFLIHRRGNVPAENETNKTFWVSGGAGIFRKDIWRKLNGMQELYNPFYWEDIDLSYRALKAGYRIVFEPHARVIHIQSTGSIRSSFSPHQIKTTAYRNQLFFVWLNISDIHYLLQHGIWIPIHLLKAAASGDWAFLQGLMDAVRKLPAVVRQRLRNKIRWVKTDEGVISMLQYLS